MNTQVNPKLVSKYMNLFSENATHIEEQEIVNARSFINNKLRHDRETFNAIMSKATSFPKLLTEAHEAKGIAWLLRTQFKKNGELSSAKTTFLGLREAHVVKNFSHFEFIGLQDEGDSNWSQVFPVYKVYATDGSTFEYVASGNPKVVG
jgi:hypothetical protein